MIKCMSFLIEALKKSRGYYISALRKLDCHIVYGCQRYEIYVAHT